MHEVADGLLQAGLGDAVELAVLPLGTCKDFARSLRIPRSPLVRTPRSGGGPPRAAHLRSSSSAAHSFQVGDRGQLLDGVALQREIRPLAPLLPLQ